MDPELLVLAGDTSTPIAFDQVPICSTIRAAKEAVQLPAEAATVADRILAKLPPTEAGANRCAIS